MLVGLGHLLRRRSNPADTMKTTAPVCAYRRGQLQCPEPGAVIASLASPLDWPGCVRDLRLGAPIGGCILAEVMVFLFGVAVLTGFGFGAVLFIAANLKGE